MKLFKGALFGLVAAVAVGVFAGSDLGDRIKPVGETCMAGDDCAAAVVAAADAGAARSGEQVYQKCATCHATGAAGAPKLGDAAGWAPRLEKGLDELYANAIGGFKGMPAKGLCFDCSDDEIKAAVDYMVEGSK
jgi:Cytochrome c5